MSKKILIMIFPLIILGVIGAVIVNNFHSKEEKKVHTKKMEAMVLASNDNEVMVQDKNNIIYTFELQEVDADLGDHIVIEYTGLLDKMNVLQKTNVISYEIKDVITDEDGVPVDYLDQGIFSDYYILAYNKLKELSLDEKISQLLLVRYPDENQTEILKKYPFGGYVFFAKDFKDQTKSQISSNMKTLQNSSNIPILTAVDEEGGGVVRISSNRNLRSEPFKSSRDLYQEGGLDRIKKDTIEKSDLLNELGLNVNLAPVVDVSTSPSDYMYSRSLGENTEITSNYAKTVIEASKGHKVSYTLKHFPGYGHNSDTHKAGSLDKRTYEEIINTAIPPFEEGIKEEVKEYISNLN